MVRLGPCAETPIDGPRLPDQHRQNEHSREECRISDAVCSVLYVIIIGVGVVTATTKFNASTRYHRAFCLPSWMPPPYDPQWTAIASGD